MASYIQGFTEHGLIFIFCYFQVFVSIKGIYYQAEVGGVKLMWVVPYSFPVQVSVLINNSSVNKVYLTKFMGVTMDDKLTWRIIFNILSKVEVKL